MSTIVVKFGEKRDQYRGPKLSTRRGRMISGGIPKDRNFEGLSNNEIDTIAKTEVSIVEDLSAKEIAELNASDEHVVANEIPLKLIKSNSNTSATTDIASQTVGSVSWGVKAIGADTSTYDGRGIRVAVLDTGIDEYHPAFTDPNLNITKKNFTQYSPDDTDGHGTHCAGTIFGRDVNGTRIGVAKGITEAFIAKVIPAGSSALINALNWAYKNKCHAASMSLGFDFPKLVFELSNEGMAFKAAVSLGLTEYRNNIAALDALMDLYRARELQAHEHGMVVVAASGNESNRPDFTIDSAPPSAALGVLSVGAIWQSSDNYGIANFSNSKPDLVAPGVNVLSARAQVGDLAPLDGTSMACPHVAGAAALYFQRALQGLGAFPNAGGVAAEIKVLTKKIGLAQSDGGSGLVQVPQ